MQQSDTTNNDYKKKLLKCIKDQAVGVGKVKLSSGKISDLYVDVKMVTLDSEGAFLTAMVLVDLLKDEEIDMIGGMTMGADPIVGAVAAISYLENNPIKTFIIRKQPKEHGKQKWIEGPLSNTAKIAIIDDVTTTGKSLLESIDIIKKTTDCEVVKVITLVDRLEGGQEALKQKGYDLVSIFTRKDLLGD